MAHKVLGGIYRPGVSPITRESNRDMTVRVTQLDYNGTSIEADLIAENGRGNVEIQKGNDRVYILLTKDEGQPLEDRVQVMLEDRRGYLSLHDIRVMLPSVRA